MRQQLVLSEYPVKRRLTGDVDPTVGQDRNDLLRMLVPELRTAGDLDNSRPLELCQFVVNELRAASSVAIWIFLPAVIAACIN